MLNERLSQLRDLVHEEPSQDSWGRICDLLYAWPLDDGLDTGVDYAVTHQEHWPDAMRYARHKWVALFFQPVPDPRCRLVRSLVIEHQRPALDTVAVRRLNAALAASTITWLEVRVKLGAKLGEQLVRGAGLSHLKGLHLDGCAIDDTTVEALADAKWLEGLESLEISWNSDVTSRCLSALCSSQALVGLEKLTMNFNNIDDEGIEVLANSALLERLKILKLVGNSIGDDGAQSLAASPNLVRLVDLDLGSNLLSRSGYAALANSSYLSEPLKRRFWLFS